MASSSVFSKRNVNLTSKYTITGGEFHVVTFYGVKIVEYNPHLDFVVLRAYDRTTSAANMYSVTTKRHINDVLTAFDVPLRVYAEKGNWFVRNVETGGIVPFVNAANFNFRVSLF